MWGCPCQASRTRFIDAEIWIWVRVDSCLWGTRIVVNSMSHRVASHLNSKFLSWCSRTKKLVQLVLGECVWYTYLCKYVHTHTRPPLHIDAIPLPPNTHTHTQKYICLNAYHEVSSLHVPIMFIGIQDLSTKKSWVCVYIFIYSYIHAYPYTYTFTHMKHAYSHRSMLWKYDMSIYNIYVSIHIMQMYQYLDVYIHGSLRTSSQNACGACLIYVCVICVWVFSVRVMHMCWRAWLCVRGCVRMCTCVCQRMRACARIIGSWGGCPFFTPRIFFVSDFVGGCFVCVCPHEFASWLRETEQGGQQEKGEGAYVCGGGGGGERRSTRVRLAHP